MPEAPPQRDHRRRRTDQDRPEVPGRDEIYDMVAQQHDCGCFESCLLPTAAIVEIADLAGETTTNWPYRWTFTFQAADADYYAFMQAESPIILTWNGVDKWVSDAVLGPCPGGSGGETPEYRWELTWTSSSLAANVWTLSLVRDGGTGTCDEWVDLVYINMRWFDPLCGNLMIPQARGLVAPYSDGLSCKICVEPVVLTTDITCLAEAMTVPTMLGISIPDFSGTCADAADMVGDVIPFVHDSGCVWSWSSSISVAFDPPCDDLTLSWEGTIEIVDVGGGDVKVVLTMTYNYTSTGSAGCQCFDDPAADPECTQTAVMESDTMPIEDVAEFLLSGFRVLDVVGGVPNGCIDEFLSELQVGPL